MSIIVGSWGKRFEFAGGMAAGRVGALGAVGALALLLAVAGVALGSLPARAASAVGGEVLLNETFDGVTDGELPAGFNVVAGDWQVQGGKLVGTANDQYTPAIVLFGDPAWDNYLFEADVTFVSVMEGTRWASLIFWADTSGLPYYQLAVRQKTTNPNGYEIAFRQADGNWDVPADRKTAGTFVFELGATHHLAGVASAGAVRYYVDGKLVLSYEHLPVPNSGRLGFSLAGGKVIFDNLKVTRVDPAAPPVL